MHLRMKSKLGGTEVSEPIGCNERGIAQENRAIENSLGHRNWKIADAQRGTFDFDDLAVARGASTKSSGTAASATPSKSAANAK